MAKKGWQDDARESAHRIWLAGLGALAKAEEEGSKLFKNLVREGERYETAGKATVKSGIGGAKRGLDEAAERTRRTAEETWSKIEEGLDDRLARTLHRVGVPTRDEIAALSRRVEELTSALDRMRQREKATPSAPKTTATAAAARARATAAKPRATAAKPVATVSKPAAAKPKAAPRAASAGARPGAVRRPAPAKPATARRVAPSPVAAPKPTPAPSPTAAPASPVPEKITTPRDVTTTADVKTGPR